MPVFSFRAECHHDADAFIRAAEHAGIAASWTTHPDASGFPDVDVEASFDASNNCAPCCARFQIATLSSRRCVSSHWPTTRLCVTTMFPEGVNREERSAR